MDASDPLQTRPSLLVRIRDPKDAESWRAFTTAYAPLIYNYGRRKGLQDADAAELCQEVMIEVARSIRQFEYQPERGRFRDWLGTVTFRRMARLHSMKARGEKERHLPVNSGEFAPSTSAALDPEWTDEFNAQILAAAIERVRPHFEATTWRAFERVWLDGMPAADVAIELGISIVSVYVAKSRVLKRLEEEVWALANDVPHLAPLD
jgi:RNA polymerase sigma-70 factor (ECF subfamily)